MPQPGDVLKRIEILEAEIARLKKRTTIGGGGTPPSSHAENHQNGGSDELSVTGLSGLLADPQTPLAHATSHEDGGSDELDVAALGGFPGGTTTFLRADRTFAVPSADVLGLTGTIGAWLVAVGDQVFIECPFDGEIIAARIAGFDATGASVSGDAVVDIWKDVYANYPPTLADTITASAKPTLTGDAIVEDETLTGWTVAVAAGDWCVFTLESMATAEKVLVQLTVLRS